MKCVLKVSALPVLVLLTVMSLWPPSVRAAQPFSIEISTLPAGFSTYTIGVALAELINKNSTWLKATALEGRGAAIHMKTLVRNPQKRKSYLFLNDPWELWSAKRGLGAFAGFDFDYNEFKFVFFIGMGVDGLVTLNPNIKTLKDMAGQRVCFDSSPGKSRELIYKEILTLAGVDLKSLKQQYAGGKLMADRLRDGLLDVGYTGALLVKWPNTLKSSPFIRQLAATKDAYFISFPEEAVNAFKQKTKHPLLYVRTPPKTYGPLQTQQVGALGRLSGFCAHQSMPDEVVAEILRVTCQNADKFKNYTPLAAGISQKTLAGMGVPESSYHPAAVSFFKRKGIIPIQ